MLELLLTVPNLSKFMPSCSLIRKGESGLLSNQGEKSTNFYFIRVPLRKKVLKYGTPKPRNTSHALLRSASKGLETCKQLESKVELSAEGNDGASLHLNANLCSYLGLGF